MNWLPRKCSLIRFHGDVVPILPIIIWPLATALSWPGGRLSDGSAQTIPQMDVDTMGRGYPYGDRHLWLLVALLLFPSISSSQRYGSHNSTSVRMLCYPVAIVCHLPLSLEAPSAVEQTLVPVQSSGSFKMEWDFPCGYSHVNWTSSDPSSRRLLISARAPSLEEFEVEEEDWKYREMRLPTPSREFPSG
jgi:hypothetical protein